MHITKLSLQTLRDLNPAIRLLRIRSCDPEVYLVEIESGDGCYLITDERGKVAKFRGMTAAKRPFEGLKIERAVLVHESAYDEMIGQPASHNTMEVNISLP